MGHGRADARRLRPHALTCRPRRHFDNLLQTTTADHIECRRRYWRCARLAVDMHRGGGGRGSPSTNAMAMAGPGGFGVSLGALPGRLGHRGCAVCSGGGVPHLQLECHIGGQILTRSPTVNELVATEGPGRVHTDGITRAATYLVLGLVVDRCTRGTIRPAELFPSGTCGLIYRALKFACWRFCTT